MGLGLGLYKIILFIDAAFALMLLHITETETVIPYEDVWNGREVGSSGPGQLWDGSE